MPKIQNRENLASPAGEYPLRDHALTILESGLEAIDTEKVLRKKLTYKQGTLCIDGQDFICHTADRIFFVGIGKCANAGAEVIEEILGDDLTEGIVVDTKTGVFKNMRSFAGTHPLPTERNIEASKAVVSMLEKATEKDLVIVFISGGGSALLCLPHQMNCEELADITKKLMEKGADIHEVNTVRKHLSKIQGGQLAKIAYPATIISLIFSDVPGDDISVIASGPTVPDVTTTEDAERILAKYEIRNICLKPNCEIIETPKENGYFEKVSNLLILSNRDALKAMKETSEKLGYDTEIVTNILTGEAKDIGEQIANEKVGAKTCKLYGGETTVNLPEGVFGEGGRNQEFSLSALLHINDDELVVSCASDGRDNTDALGGIADKTTKEKAKANGLDPGNFLTSHTSYDFFKKTESQIITGETGSNVSDLIIKLTK